MRFLLMLLLVACPRTTPEVVPAATVPDTTVVVEATTGSTTVAPIPVDMSAGDGPVDNSNGGEVTVPADVVATAAK